MAMNYGTPLRNVRAFGSFWIIYGVLQLALGLWLFLFSATAALMCGALLVRVPDPFTLMSAFHFLYALLVIWHAASGVLALVAGWALLDGQGSARTLALLASFFSLAHLPLGTTLGIYTMIVLLPWSAGQVSGRIKTSQAA